MNDFPLTPVPDRARIVAAMESMRQLVREHVNDGGSTLEYVRLSEDRIVHSVEAVLKLNPPPQKACEIGLGPVGLTWHLLTGHPLIAVDIRETYIELCKSLGVPLHIINIRKEGALNVEPCDLVMFFEVIEHIDRPPNHLLDEISKVLIPGGHLMLSTVNLTRLSNRIRLLLGRPIFADYHPELLVMAHFREYTREELERYLVATGYTDVHAEYFCQPDTRRGPLPALIYRATCKVFPRLSNVMFIRGRSGTGGA